MVVFQGIKKNEILLLIFLKTCTLRTYFIYLHFAFAAFLFRRNSWLDQLSHLKKNFFWKKKYFSFRINKLELLKKNELATCLLAKAAHLLFQKQLQVSKKKFVNKKYFFLMNRKKILNIFIYFLLLS